MRWLSLLLIFAFAAPVHAQDNEAEKLYRTMEKKIRSCKSVQLTFDADTPLEKGLQIKLKGTLRWAVGDKIRIEMDADLFGKQMKMLMLCDGKTMYTKMDEQVQTQDKPADAGVDQISGFISRIGLASAFMSTAVLGEKKERFDLDKELPIKDFKLGAREKIGKVNAQVVEYTVTAKGKEFKVSVWIDPQVSLPLKRTVEADGNRVVENYGAFTIDGRLDTKMFEVPK
jgi:hypothetical protein